MKGLLADTKAIGCSDWGATRKPADVAGDRGSPAPNSQLLCELFFGEGVD